MKTGFNAIGLPIPFYRQQAGYSLAKELGVSSEDSHSMIKAMSEQLERDNPFKAQEIGMKYVDLVGVYRLISILLTAGEKNVLHSTNISAS
jgi:hypothetical protein